MEHQDSPVPSTAAIMGHPIHPMLIPFPVASLVGVVLTDIAAQVTDNDFWTEASRWLLLVGLVTGAFAAIFGFIDFASTKRIRDHSIAWVHFLGNGIALLLTFINLILRPEDPAEGVPTLGLILSVVVAGIFCVTGWLGGELSYRHKIGVLPTATDERAAERSVSFGD